MPRRNHRKHYKGEGSLGFNPDKYIGRKEYQGRSPTRYVVKIAQGSAYDYKPSKDRHKAHSPNERKRRAMEDIRQMQQSAGRVPQLTTRSAQAVDRPISEHFDPESKQETQERITDKTIFGGITTWLNRKLQPA